MFIYVILIVILILFFVAVKNKVRIDILSFLHKTIPLSRGVFGVYCFTGKQGSGKTYALNKFIFKKAKGKKVYSNSTHYDFDYIPITSMEMLLSLRDEKNCYIIFDEIFTFISKQFKVNPSLAKDLTEFLTQMRKQENIFITTAQEWLELPIEFRRYVRIQVQCTTRVLPLFHGILIEKYYDTTQIKWDNLENEYISPIISTKISRYEKRFMERYDTFERIKQLPLTEPVVNQ